MDAPFQLGDAKVDIKWRMTDISSFSVSATPGFPDGQPCWTAGVDPQAILDRLYQLRDSMAVLCGRAVPAGRLDQVISLAETVDENLLAPLSNVGTQTVPFSTIQDFVGETAGKWAILRLWGQT
jgi:hypothetical protein